MFRVLVWGLSLVLMACASGAKEEASRAQLHLQIGTAHLKKANYPAAMSELRKAEELDPNNPKIQNNLALAYYVRERLKEAEVHFNKALKADPSFTEARNNLGKLLIQQQRYNEAIQQLEVAASDLTYPHPERSFANLGTAYFMAGKYKLARDRFRDALKIRPEDCKSFHYYGRSLFELSQHKEAAAAFDNAIRLCKNSPLAEPHYFAALSYTKIGQREEAVARLEELIKSYPSTEYTHKAQAMLEMLK